MKQKDLIKELRGMTPPDLKKRALEIAEELMKLRFQRRTGQLEQSHRLNELKKELARIKTILAERARTEAAA